MEDMKGKIRVYVRIRPFSSSEMERNCQDAVLKVNCLIDIYSYFDQIINQL